MLESDGLRARIGRKVRAELRYFLILLRTFRVSLAAFVILLVVGASVLHASYDPTEGPGFEGWLHAVNATFNLIFLENALPRYPDAWTGQVALLLIPPIGICIVVDGFVRFGVLFFNRSQNMKEWTTAIASTYRDHVVIGGLGRIGYRVVEHLATDPALQIVVVEKDEKSPFFDELREMEIPYVVGDVTHMDILRRCHVERAATVVCATDSDLANIEMALNARELSPDTRIVLRMFNDRMARRIADAASIGTVLSTSHLSAPAFAAACYSDRIIGSIETDGVTLHSARLPVGEGAEAAGWEVRELEERTGGDCVLHARDGDGRRPDPSDRIAVGDHVVLLASLTEIRDAEELLGLDGRATVPRGDDGADGPLSRAPRPSFPGEGERPLPASSSGSDPDEGSDS